MAWNKHPRSQIQREEYCILNDGWELNSRPIRMPFPPQSKLSGYDGDVLRPKERLLFVSECGGYQYLAKGHFFGEKEYGYGACKDSDALTARIEEMYEKMILPYIRDGVCGCIYTQLSDVEGEINGMYTYDRQICKPDKKRMQTLAEKLGDKSFYEKI